MHGTIRASVSEDAVEMTMLSEITGFAFEDFQYFVRAYGTEKRYVITISSQGGDPFAAFAIRDYIKANGIKATARIYGLAASAAALIACACDTVEMGETSHLMIHDAYGGTDMALLESLNAKQAEVFAKKTGKSTKEIRKMMAAETWMDAKTAKREGFADSLIAMRMAALYKAQFMEKEVENATEEVVDTPVEETVEVEVPVEVSIAQAVESKLTGKPIMAKVKRPKAEAEAIASLTEEVKAKAKEADEFKAEAEGLREKLSAADDARTKAEAERDELKASAEKSAETIKDLTASLEKVKGEPVKASADGVPDKAVQVPGGGPTDGKRVKSKEERKEERRAAVEGAMEQVFNKRKGK